MDTPAVLVAGTSIIIYVFDITSTFAADPSMVAVMLVKVGLQ